MATDILLSRTVEIEGLQIKLELREVSPELAQQWLAMNDKNRNLRTKHAGKLTRLMEIDEFKFVGDPIRFSHTKRLIDGQHRLISIVRSGKSQIMLVLWGFDDGDQQYIDGGAARNASDQVGLLLEKPQPSVWASITRLLIRWEAEDLLKNSITPSTPEVVEYISRHDDQLARAVNAARAVYATVRGSMAASGAAYVMAERVAPALAIKFWRELANGEGLLRGMPVYALRDSLLRRNSKRWRTEEELAAYVRAFNTARKGGQLQRMQVTRGSLTLKDNLTIR